MTNDLIVYRWQWEKFGAMAAAIAENPNNNKKTSALSGAIGHSLGCAAHFNSKKTNLPVQCDYFLSL